MITAYLFIFMPLSLIIMICVIPEPFTIYSTLLIKIYLLILIFGIATVFYWFVKPKFEKVKFSNLIYMLTFFLSGLITAIIFSIK